VTEVGAIGVTLAAVRERIEAACARAGRQASEVRLLAVSKGHGPEAILAAYAAGQREFGENYVQELAGKAAALGHLADLRFRFIGRLQRNKLRTLVELGCSIDSVDSSALGQALSAHAQRLGREVEALIQVNVDREPQKAGVLPEHTLELARELEALPGVRLRGLMAIPRASEDPVALRASFQRLRALGAGARLPEVSMGMSADMELAIEEGATIVRVGTAIFGPRPVRAGT
jgi:pyridoxal phosphate enzyme (YggS family)